MQTYPFICLILLALASFLSPLNLVGRQPPQESAQRQGTDPRHSPPSTYQLGSSDEIMLQGPEAEEIVNKPFRIDPGGEISLPMIGRFHAAGLTVHQIEDEVNKRLATFVRDPQIVVNVLEFRSQPVSVLGAVNQPGNQQLQGRKTLAEMISMAGGFRPDAGHTVKITRELQWGHIPLANAMDDSSGGFSVGEVSVQQLLQAKDPQVNILIMPHDVITVPPAQLVYVVGDVKRSGGFVLGDREAMSVLQALALAEGLVNTADTRHSRILRRTSNSTEPVEVTVNLKLILQGKSNDIQLEGGDVLFVPGSTSKKMGIRTAEAIIQTASGLAVWRF